MKLSRRNLLKIGAVVAGFPTIVPSSVFGQAAPSNRVNVAVVGLGRYGRTNDIPLTLANDDAQVVAVCDLDTKRLGAGMQLVDTLYARKLGKAYSGTRGVTDFHELLSDQVDAIVLSTPDHHHAPHVIKAMRAGKHVYLQKPAALTIAEGRAMSNAVKTAGKVLQIGSQQRSQDPWPQFHRAGELVRNGRIGQLKHVEVGIPIDPAGPEAPPMRIPANLDYDAWLGSTPEIPYTELRVHPQDSFEARGGWMRCEQFGAGMITVWGAHHIDSAHWAMGTELTGPVEVWGKAEFPTSGVWNVHGKLESHALYANGVTMTVSDGLPVGIKFIGDKGWIFVTRTEPNVVPLSASDPAILGSVIGPGEVQLYKAPEMHRNWLDAIHKGVPVAASMEVGHRSCSTCILHWMAMRTGRRLKWDPAAERFIGDDAANAMLSRPQRAKYAI